MTRDPVIALGCIDDGNDDYRSQQPSHKFYNNKKGSTSTSRHFILTAGLPTNLSNLVLLLIY